MEVARGRDREGMGSYCLVGAEFQFHKTKEVPGMDGRDCGTAV